MREQRRAVAYDAGRWVHRPRERVDGDDMRRLLVPGAVLAPVGRRHLFPRVVEFRVLLEDLHGCGANVVLGARSASAIRRVGSLRCRCAI